jgi:hypothetical protein
VPTDLAALLVQEGAVSAADLDRAQARQREAGGALDTALLELELVPEARVLELLARASGLPPAPPEAWEARDPRARRVFPSRVAERHGLAPFALDGRELALVAVAPVDLGLLDEISFMLSLHLTAHVGPEWRVRELIHRLYASPLPERFARLAERAGPAAPPAAAPPAADAPAAPATSAPPAGSGPPAGPASDAPAAPAEADADLPPLTLAFAEPPGAPAPADGEAEHEAPPAARREGASPAAEAEPASPQPAGFRREAGEPLEPLAEALAQALEEIDLDAFLEDEAPAAQPPGVAPREPGAAEAAAAEAPGPAAPAPVVDRTAPPRWTPEAARAALASATGRDQAVVTCLRYARDFFEFAAIFAVTRDAVAGHDALGPEEDARDRCRGVAIYTSDPGIFRTVLETRAPYLGPVTRDPAGNDAVLLGLGRGTPRTVLVAPVLVRDRPVCLFYADNGEAPVSARRLGDLLVLFSGLGPALERILRDRKERLRARREAGASAAPPAPAPAEGWVAREPARMAPLARTPAPSSSPLPAPTPRGGEAVAEAAAPPLAAAPPSRGGGSAAGVAASSPAVLARSPAAPAPRERPGDAAPDPVIPPADAAAPPSLDDVEIDLDDVALVAEAPPSPAPPRSVPELLAVLSEGPPDERARAAARLGALGNPAAFGLLAERALDPDPAVAEAAREALARNRRHPAIRPLPDKLRRALLSGLGGRAAGAARAIGALRDVESIPVLIQALETSDREPAEAAADALARITLQRLGTNARRWLTWWKENRGRGRAEWLFGGLTSEDRVTRVAAAADLAEAGPPPVDWSPDLPPEARERAARTWAAWLARSGHVL